MDALSVKVTEADRRPFRRSAVWLPALLLIAAAAFAPSALATDLQPARGADSFVDSIGVNTHTFYSDTAYYGDFPLLRQRLAELGVRHIREDLVPDRPDQYQRLNELAEMGVRSDLILGDPSDGVDEIERLTSILKTEVPGAVETVEGPNEFDMRGGSEWIPRLREYQQRLYDEVKSDPSLSSLPVVAPSIVQRRNQEALGDISGALDAGNVHSYPDGEAPEGNLSSYLARAAISAGSKPVFATETGYHTALNSSGEHRPVSEEAMATYLPRLFLEYFRQGVARTYSYELIDEKADPGKTDQESNFGLLKNDLSAKPAFDALRNTIAILQDPGPAFAPGSLGYSLGGDGTGLRQVLLEKRDGSFFLALWRASSVWDPDSRTQLTPSSAPVTLSFGRHLRSAQRYMPNVSSSPLASLPVQGDRPLTVEVGAQVVILRVEPGQPKQGRIRAWVSRRSVRPGARVAVKGHLPRPLRGRSHAVKIQQWRAHGWRTVSRGRTTRSGAFRKKIRLTRRVGRASRVRVVAGVARPSRPVRIRIRS